MLDSNRYRSEDTFFITSKANQLDSNRKILPSGNIYIHTCGKRLSDDVNELIYRKHFTKTTLTLTSKTKQQKNGNRY